MVHKRLEKKSKQLSYLLRHCTEPLLIDLNGGWCPVEVLLKELDIYRWKLEVIVESDPKKRYSYDPDTDRVRANQGHSIPDVVIEMEQPDPPEYLFHGTATRFLDDILRDGLKPMSRQMVHISEDIFTATDVGRRHGEPVVLVIRAKDFVANGHKLFLSDNGIWQAKEVPRRYFDVMLFKEK